MNIPIQIQQKLIKQTKKIEEYYPILLGTDYDDGFIYRYFAKYLISNKQIIEIDKTTYLALLSKSKEYSYELYDILKIQWKLTGPYSDIIKPDKIEYGVYDTNFRTVQKAKMQFPEIEQKIYNYTEFARITI